MKVAIRNFVYNGKKYEIGMPIDPKDVKEIDKAAPDFTKEPSKKELKLIKKNFGKMIEKYEREEEKSKKKSK
jgi:hypothetical protein